MIIVIVDKPLLSRRLLPVFKNSPEPVVFLHLFYFTNIYFNYPDKVKWADYPYLEEPRYHVRDWDNWLPMQITPEGELEKTTVDTKTIQNATQVIFGGDPCSEIAYIFNFFAKEVLKKPVENHYYPALVLYSLDEKAITKAYEERDNFYPKFKGLMAAGEIKRYFDSQYNTNSFGIFGSILSSMGISNHMSKYGLLLLYILKSLEPKKEGEIVHLMSKWQGSGKYQGKGFGSVTSRLQILNNLVDMGFVERKDTLYRITDKGQEFLSLLHKDCYDPDLSFRISEWEAMPVEIAKGKINRYINTFFGKQKKKLNLYYNQLR